MNNENNNVEYQNKGQSQFNQISSPETPKLIQWVIKYSGGLVKDERQANYVLIGFVGLSLVVVIILLLNVFGGPSEPPAGYKGNIPDLPEYRNPPTPQDFR